MATGAPYDRGVTSSRIRPRSGGWTRPALLAPVVVAVVLGILGMHGIGVHGVNLHGPTTHAAHPASPTAPVMAGQDTTADVGAAVTSNHGHAAGEATSIASDQPDGQTGGTNDRGEMAMFCVAMLAGAAAALLAVLVRCGRLPQLWAVLPPAGRVQPLELAVLRVGAGPPPVWRFSVMRC